MLQDKNKNLNSDKNYNPISDDTGFKPKTPESLLDRGITYQTSWSDHHKAKKINMISLNNQHY